MKWLQRLLLAPTQAIEESAARDDDEVSETTTQTEPIAGDEKERLKQILYSVEAAGRSALAQHLALNTSLSPPDARLILAASAKDTQAGTTAGTVYGGFARALAEGLAAATDGPAQSADPQDAVARIRANYLSATGERR